MRLLHRHPERGFSLLELSVAAAVFSVLLLVVLALFNQSIYVWRVTSSADGANRELRKVRAALERDLALTSPTEIARAQVPGHLGGGASDGEALWFLSPIDPATGEIVLDEDGLPVWQRNILYYLVVPGDHAGTFGSTCAGGAAANGYDDRCPHKILIRRVIDAGTATIPTDPTTREALIAPGAIGPYLVQPTGFDISALPDTRIVANNLLCFETVSAPPPNNQAREVLVDVRAVGVEEARRETSVGTAPLYNSRFTEQHPFSVFPKN